MALGNILESFLVYLGFEVGTEELDKWTEKIGDAEVFVAGLGAAALIATGSIALLVGEMDEQIASLEEFSEMNKVSIESMQEYGYAASQTGSSLEAVKNTVQGLNEKIGEAALGIGRGAMIFKKLHLEAHNANGTVKTADQMIMELSKKMQKMSVQESLGMGKRLGIDPTFVRLMREGSDEIQRLRDKAKSFGEVSTEDAEKAVTFEKSLKNVRYMVEALAEQIAVKLTPAMQSMVDRLQAWWMQNKAVIESGIVIFTQVMTAVIGTLWDYLVKIIDATGSVVHWFLQWKIVSYALLGIITAIVGAGMLEFLGKASEGVLKLVGNLLKLEGSLENLKALLSGGVFIAILLIVDELWNFYHGNDSLIGQLNKEFPGAIYAAWAALGLLTAGFIALKWEAITSIYAIMAGMVESIAIIYLYAAAWLQAAIAENAALWPVLLVIAAVAALAFGIYELWKHWSQVTKWMGDSIETVKEKIENLIGRLHDAIAQHPWLAALAGLATGPIGLAVAGAAAMSGGGGSAPVPSRTASGGGRGGSSRSSSVSTQTVIHAPVTIMTPDPEKAGKSVSDHLDRKGNKDTTRNGQSAVIL